MITVTNQRGCGWASIYRDQAWLAWPTPPQSLDIFQGKQSCFISIEQGNKESLENANFCQDPHWENNYPGGGALWLHWECEGKDSGNETRKLFWKKSQWLILFLINRTRREFPQTSRGWSLLESSWRTAGPSLTTTSRRRALSILCSDWEEETKFCGSSSFSIFGVAFRTVFTLTQNSKFVSFQQ